MARAYLGLAHAVMNGISFTVLARNLGYADTPNYDT